MERNKNFIIVALMGLFSIFFAQAQSASTDQNASLSDKEIWEKNKKLFHGSKIAEGSLYELKESGATVNVVFDFSQEYIVNRKGEILNHIDMAEGSDLLQYIELGETFFEKHFVAWYNQAYSKKTGVRFATDDATAAYNMEIIPYAVFIEVKKGAAMVSISALIKCEKKGDKIFYMTSHRDYSFKPGLFAKTDDGESVKTCFGAVAEQITADIAKAITKAKAPK